MNPGVSAAVPRGAICVGESDAADGKFDDRLTDLRVLLLVGFTFPARDDVVREGTVAKAEGTEFSVFGRVDDSPATKLVVTCASEDRAGFVFAGAVSEDFIEVAERCP